MALYIDEVEVEKERRYPTASGMLDGSIWKAWHEMEGDTDGSGQAAVHVGDFDRTPTSQEPLGAFINEPVEGSVLKKTSVIPLFASGYGQNIGASLSGHCIWEFEVLRRDQSMNLGLVIPDAFDGEFDRRWDAKCFSSQAWFWAVTSGVLMNGPLVEKTLPTKKVPYYHYHLGDTVRLDLKVDPRRLSGKILNINSEEAPFTNLHLVKVRVEPDEGTDIKFDEKIDLPQLYNPETYSVYTPEDWDFADRSFYIKIRTHLDPKIGQVLSLHYTGKLTISLNNNFIGSFSGVPNTAVPGALLNGDGDMVSLRCVWSDRDQEMIDTIRESTLELMGGEFCPENYQKVIKDKVQGLKDWTILKALRVNAYKADLAFQDLRNYIESHTIRLMDKMSSRVRLDIAAEGMYGKEDYKNSDAFVMKDPQGKALLWKPNSIKQALSWKPGR